MKSLQGYVSSAIFLWLPLTNAVKTLLIEDFEDYQLVDQAVRGADIVRPTIPSDDLAVIIIDPINNLAGTGNGVRMIDNDSNSGAQLAYDFVIDVFQQVSTLEIHLAFSVLDDLIESGHYFAISLGEFAGNFNSASNRFIDCRLYSDGTIDFVSSVGPSSFNNALEIGKNNTLSIYANDYNAKSISYIDPYTDVRQELPPNSIAYWLNGYQILFEGQNSTLMQDRVTSKGSVFGSEGNFGKFGISSYSHHYGLDIIIDNLRILTVEVEEIQHTSSLVYTSETNGSLVYTKFANENSDIRENVIPDFSSSGYKGGGVPIPFVPTIEIIHPTNENDHSHVIQTAIDNVSNIEINEDGFRGAIFLKAGVYRVNNTLKISSSGIVIRGEGSGELDGTTIIYTANAQSNLFEVESVGSGPQEISGSRTSVIDTFVPVGSITFNVTDSSLYSPGDRIMIEYGVNEKWITDLSNMTQWGWTAQLYQLKFRRDIIEIDTVNNQITIDAPIVQAIEAQYGGVDIYKFQFVGMVTNVGFEGLRLESTYSSEEDENHGWTAIMIRRLTNGWVRQVTGLYFGFGLVSINDFSYQVTVEDCAMLNHKSIITGGRRYSFNIDDAEKVLMQRCLTSEGRHDYVSGSQTSGPNVFVDCLAINAYSDIGPHHRYSTGQLYDNVKGSDINVQNRENSGSGHGWAGAQIMFWNCEADIICDAPNGAMNWAIGNVGSQREGSFASDEPFGFWDSHNQPVIPRSLYYKQLVERLELNSLKSIALPKQINGSRIWDDLRTWNGNGLFLDSVVVYITHGHFLEPLVPISVNGIVRDLQMMENGFSSLWSKVLGPGTVSFTDDAMLETTVSFDTQGFYEIQLSISSGSRNVFASLFVTVTDMVQPSSRPTLHPNMTPTSQLTLTPSTFPSTEITSRPSKKPTIHPTLFPTVVLSSSPTLDMVQLSFAPSSTTTDTPSLMPSSELTLPCYDALLQLSYNGSGLTCSKIFLYNACTIEVAQSHCPNICNACPDYKCEDSLAPFIVNGISIRCADLQDLSDSKIDEYCELPQLYTTCRETCEICNI